MKCPICLLNEAISPHHIKPRSEGGSDDKYNIYMLCIRCHNIVEYEYYEHGKYLTPDLIDIIRLNYDLSLSQSIIIHPDTNYDPTISLSLKDNIKDNHQHINGNAAVYNKLEYKCRNCHESFIRKNYLQIYCPQCKKRSSWSDLKRWKIINPNINIKVVKRLTNYHLTHKKKRCL